MIILDTHIVICVEKNPRLTESQFDLIENYRTDGLGISVFSCWEIAKLVEKQRLGLNIPVEDWLTQALAYPDIAIISIMKHISIPTHPPYQRGLEIANVPHSDGKCYIVLIDLTIPIIIQSTKLVNFHKDPADQIIVATAKVYDCSLFTLDRKILDYPDVKTRR